MIKIFGFIVYLFVLLIYVYIVVFEMVFWKMCGLKVFCMMFEKVVEIVVMVFN